jgi:hemerythrin-like domain-containing protein
MRSIRIINDEHRSLAAVLHGLLYLVREIRDRGAKPDYELLSAMVYYIDAFPERYHHPKEDEYLFKLLRVRAPEIAPLLDELHAEHSESKRRIRDMEQALTRYREGGANEFAGFSDTVEAYATFHWSHMRKEEQEVLPIAREKLTPGDWEAIDAAFTGHTDPLFGAEPGSAWEHIFRRIVNLAPPPIGVGPPQDQRRG